MPLRGESVGTAYVRILADGTGFPDSLRNEVDKNTGPLEDAGSRGAKAYQRGFNEETKKNFGHEFDDAFVQAVKDADVAADFFDKNPQWDRFRKNVHARFGQAGEDAITSMEQEFLRKGSLGGIEKEVGNIVGRVNAEWDRSIAHERTAATEREREMSRFVTDFRRTMSETDTISQRAGTVAEDAGHRVVSAWDGVRNAATKLRREWTDGEKAIHKWETATGVADHAGVRLAKTIDSMAVGMGKAFGAGSRNNFVNFFGKFVENSAKLLGVFPRLLGNIGEFKDGFNAARTAGEGLFSAAQTGFTTMGKDAEGASTSLSTLFETGPVGFIALGAAILAIIPLLGIITSLISSLAAAVVALASSIAFALVGAFAALAPLLPVVALGIGGIAAAVLTLSKTQKARFLKPLLNDLKELGTVTRDHFINNFNTSLGETHKILKGLEPIMARVGNSLGIVATHLVKGFKSDTFKNFRDQFAGFIPDALRSIGFIIQHSLGGLAAIFVDAIPFARNFLHWLNGIAGHFDKWANTHPGEIFKFLSDGVDSAKNLLKFLGRVGAVIIDLLFNKSGKKAGDSIIGDLSNQVHNLDKYLDNHPGSVARWFKNGKQTATDLGHFVKNIITLFDELNSPGGQQALHAIFQVANAIGWLAVQLAKITDALWAPIEFGIWIMHRLGDGAEWAWKKLRQFFNFLKNHVGGLGDNTLSLNPSGLVKWIPGVMGRIQNFFGSLPGMAFSAGRSIGQALSRAATAMGAAIGRGVSNVNRLLGGIPARMVSIGGQIAQAAGAWAIGIISNITGIPGQIVDLFRGLGQRIMDAIGSINLHINVPHIHIPGTNITTASGGVFDQAQTRIIAEAGAEAVVPLNRPLSQVDPSVRWLSAIAQGLTPPPGSGPATGRGITNHWNITTPTTDPAAVASELLNRMIASAI